MFRCGVSYSGQESCQEEGLVVDEFVSLLAREQVEEVGFCDGFSGSLKFDIVVAGSGFFTGLCCVGFYELAVYLCSIGDGGVVVPVVGCFALGCCCDDRVLA